jgi:hypothetical protein
MRPAQRRLLALRLAQFAGSATSALVVLFLGSALWLGGAWLYGEYTLRTAENALPELLDGRRYRYLSDAAIIEAAPTWAKEHGVEMRREWIRVGIDDGGFGLRAGERRAEGMDAELRALGAAVGTRAEDARVQVTAKAVFEKRVFPFTIRRLAEGAAGTERSAAYRTTGAGPLETPDAILGVALIDAEWWSPPPPGLQPLPPPLSPVVTALDAWRRAEQTLAAAVGRSALEVAGPPPAASRRPGDRPERPSGPRPRAQSAGGPPARRWTKGAFGLDRRRGRRVRRSRRCCHGPPGLRPRSGDLFRGARSLARSLRRARTRRSRRARACAGGRRRRRPLTRRGVRTRAPRIGCVDAPTRDPENPAP